MFPRHKGVDFAVVKRWRSSGTNRAGIFLDSPRRQIGPENFTRVGMVTGNRFIWANLFLSEESFADNGTRRPTGADWFFP